MREYLEDISKQSRKDSTRQISTVASIHPSIRYLFHLSGSSPRRWLQQPATSTVPCRQSLGFSLRCLGSFLSRIFFFLFILHTDPERDTDISYNFSLIFLKTFGFFCHLTSKKLFYYLLFPFLFFSCRVYREKQSGRDQSGWYLIVLPDLR